MILRSVHAPPAPALQEDSEASSPQAPNDRPPSHVRVIGDSGRRLEAKERESVAWYRSPDPEAPGTSRFLPDIAPADPLPSPLFTRAARVFILVGVWALLIMAAFACWLATPR